MTMLEEILEHGAPLTGLGVLLIVAAILTAVALALLLWRWLGKDQSPLRCCGTCNHWGAIDFTCRVGAIAIRRVLSHHGGKCVKWQQARLDDLLEELRNA